MAKAKNSNTNFDGPSDSTGTVTVACRLPGGLRIENVPGHGVILLKGSNDQRALQLADEYGAHGLTSGVPADAWAWIEENFAKAKWMTSGAVFAATKSKSVAAQARERDGQNVGFNGLDPEDLPAKIEDAIAAEAARS